MVVGLGTGSTAAFVLDALARRIREGLRITEFGLAMKSEIEKSREQVQNVE